VVAQSSIVTAAASILAELILDPAAVRGTGGVAGPMLEIPLRITMPGRSQLVMGIESMQVELGATTSMTSAGFRLAEPDIIMGIGGSTSMSGGPRGSRHHATARFGLSSGQVAALADHAENALPSPAELTLQVHARCVAVENADLADDYGDGRSFLLGGLAGDELGRVRLGYAQHIHRAQGATVTRTLAVTGGWQTSKEPGLLEASRARQGTDWFVSREDLGVEGHDSDRISRLAENMRRSHAQTPSLAHPEMPDRDYGTSFHRSIAPSRTSRIPGIVRAISRVVNPPAQERTRLSRRARSYSPTP